MHLTASTCFVVLDHFHAHLEHLCEGDMLADQIRAEIMTSFFHIQVNCNERLVRPLPQLMLAYISGLAPWLLQYHRVGYERLTA